MTSLGVTPLPPLSSSPPPPPNTEERDRDLTRLSRLTGPPPIADKVQSKVQAKELAIGVLVGLLLLLVVFGVVYAVRKGKQGKQGAPRSAAFYATVSKAPTLE